MTDRWRQVEEIFHRALELDGNARGAFLDQSCADDPLLRAEVDRLLAGASKPTDFIDTPAIEQIADGPPRSRGLWPRHVQIHSGTRLNHYEVLGPIGKGGMGEVWKSHDTRLGRDVAIKTLPVEFVNDAERLGRFEREARLLASLNHPNIATIHGLETSDGTWFLVMELVAGDTLAEKLARGAIPLEESLEIARQIAEAMDAAHRAGVIHRDLKPANIQVRRDGHVKVLDFGLAKATERASADPRVLSSPTLSLAASQRGVILGTPAYMAPEQARGRPIDRRADMWAFGALLFEMLSGAPAFPGEDVSDVIATVLKSNPDWSLLPSETPPALGRLLRRCLEKDPKQRLGDAGTALLEIADAQAERSEPAPPPVSRAARWKPALLMFLAAGLVAGAAMAAALVQRDSPERTPIRFPVAPPGDATLNDQGVAVSPDGRTLVFSASEPDGRTLLFQRRADQMEAIAVPGTQGATLPFFSPDGAWVGFFANGLLKKVRLDGTTATAITSVPRARLGAAWLEDGTIVFARLLSDSLWKVSDAGGDATPIESIPMEPPLRWPAPLPGGTHVLVTIWESPLSQASIGVKSLESGQLTRLTTGSSPRYASTGHIVYWDEDALWAVGFDPENLQLRGEPVPAVRGVTAHALGNAEFDVGSGGSLAFRPGGARVDRRLVWAGRDGSVSLLWDEPREYAAPELSPDGTRVAVIAADNNNVDIWIYDVERGVPTRLTRDVGRDDDPVWSHDGETLFFNSNREGTSGIYRVAADGSAEAEVLIRGIEGLHMYPQSVSPDGTLLVYGRGSLTAPDLWITPIDAPESAELLVGTAGADWGARFSPDGRWIAYQSTESGVFEVFVRPVPPGVGRWKVSVAGGMQPRWSVNGRELYYRTDAGIMAVPLDPESDTFSFERAQLLMTGDFAGGQSGVMTAGERYPDYSVDGNGERFLMLMEVGRSYASDVVMVMNWHQALLERAPVP